MPTATVFILPNQEEPIERLKKEWGVKSNADIIMRIIEEYLKLHFKEGRK